MEQVSLIEILSRASEMKHRFDYQTLQAVFKEIDEELEQDWINISFRFTDAAKKHTNWTDGNFRHILKEHVNGGLHKLYLLNDSWVKISRGEPTFLYNGKPTIKEVI